MSLDNFQRKENTDSSLNTSKEATKEATKEVTKETQNSLNNLDKKILISTIKWALETNILLLNKIGKENEITEYLLNGDYGSRKNREIDLILDQISSSDIRLYNIISKYIDPKYKQSLKPSIQQPTQAPSTNPEKSDNWLVNKMVSGVKEAASGAMETFSTIVSRAKEFFESTAKLVSIDGLSDAQIPILKSMIKKGHEFFNYLYGKEWTWKIDCSGFVSLLLRAGEALTVGLNSYKLYEKFKDNEVERQNVRAGDLIFWGEWGGGHVEMVVWKPYKAQQKNGKWEWCVKTLWSSSDTTGVSPMYNIDGSSSRKHNGVAYRERVIKSVRRFLRPQYGTPVAGNPKKEK